MKNLKKSSIVLCLFFVGVLTWTGCSKEEIDEIKSEISSDENIHLLKAGSSHVMIQTFTLFSEGWTSIQSNAGSWGNAGFTMAWLPPASRSADTYGYLPTQWYDYNNWRGSYSELTSCISTLKNNGITPIADIVLNHRNGNATAGADFVNPAFADNAAAVTSTDECGCGTGGADQGNDFYGGRDLNHNNSSVVALCKEYVSSLMSLGFGGGRYDMVIGYSASNANQYRTSGFNVGEYWVNNRNTINNWVNSSGMNAFDFPTYYALQSAINNNNYSGLGSIPGLIGINAGRSVTFAGNHDTESVGLLGLVYILTHPGIPCVSIDEWYSYASQIQTIIGIRKSQGIGQTSSVSVQAATSSVYAAIIDGNTAMKIGPGDWSPSSGTWTLVTSGNNYAIWTGSTSGGGSGSGMTVHAYDYTHVYFWNTSDGSTTSWPGVQMTNDGNGWYSYTFSGASSANLIFSNNGSSQTADLYRSGDGWYMDGSWYDSQPGTSSDVSITLRMQVDVGSGNALFFTGNQSSLTNWGTGVQGSWNSSNYWTTTITVPSGSSVEWKVRLGSWGGTGSTWESGSNHVISNPVNGATYTSTFNGGF